MWNRGDVHKNIRFYTSSGTSPGRGGPFGAGTLMTGRGAPLWAPEKAAAEGRPYRIFRLFHIDNFLSMLIR
jgi:hypothetical protein